MRNHAATCLSMGMLALVLSCLAPPGFAEEGKIALGMTLAQIKKNLGVVHCQVDPSNPKESYAVTMTPQYAVGGVPAFVRVQFQKGQCIESARASRITVWFRASRAEVFLASAMSDRHFGPQAVTASTKPDGSCRSSGHLPPYVHLKWEDKDKRYDVQFWSFKDRLCASKLVYTSSPTPAGTRKRAKS